MATHSRLGDETTRQAIAGVLRDIGKGVTVLNPDRKSNLGSTLHRIFIWQEIAKLAETELDLAWAAAQGEDGICDGDDLLREHGVGETEICSSKHYALVIDVKTPGSRLDAETFYKALAKAFKTTVDAIERVAGKCKLTNKASLTKRVVERV